MPISKKNYYAMYNAIMGHLYNSRAKAHRAKVCKIQAHTDESSHVQKPI